MPRRHDITRDELTDMLCEAEMVAERLRRDVLALGDRVRLLELQLARRDEIIRRQHATIRRLRRPETQARLRGIG